MVEQAIHRIAHEKATLRKDLDAWRGKPFTAEELAGFNLKNVINAACILTIVNQEGKTGNVYAKISSISKPMKGMEIPPLENEPILFDMDADDAERTLKTLPEWMREEVEKSITWKARFGAVVEDDDDGEIPF